MVTLAIILTLYFLPTIVAVGRKVPNTGSVFVVDLFLGWTFIGWVVALALAARSLGPDAHWPRSGSRVWCLMCQPGRACDRHARPGKTVAGA